MHLSVISFEISFCEAVLQICCVIASSDAIRVLSLRAELTIRSNLSISSPACPEKSCATNALPHLIGLYTQMVNDVSLAASALVVVATIVAVFQIALAAGAPWGEWAFGGQNKGALPVNLRISSIVSLLVYAAQITHYGAVAEFWVSPFGIVVAPVLDWVFVVFFSLGLVMNLISRSHKERNLWAPVVAVSLGCALVIAL